LATPDEAQRHLREATAPRYPMIAEAAKVEGRVVVVLTVGPSGKVERTRISESIPMLDAAVVEAAMSWTFEPFLVAGRPVSEQVPVSFTFVAGATPMARFSEDYVKIAGRIAACEAAAVRNAWTIAATTCEAAMKEAGGQRGRNARWTKARAGWLLARALVGLDRTAEALPGFDRAIELMPTGLPNDTIEDQFSLLAEAARAYRSSGLETRALDLYRQATSLMAKQHDYPVPRWIAIERSLLTEEADALEKAGRTKDADDRRKRAAKLE